MTLAVLISGGGTTLKNLIDHIKAGTCRAEVVCVIASREGIKGLDFPKQEGIPWFVVPRKQFKNTAAFSSAITEILHRFNPDLVVFGGFLSLYLFPPEYHGRIINIHPALLPCFGGKGMYGDHVHEAVLAAGCKVSGCSVHFVDEMYDHGPIIAQRVVPVRQDDTVETLRNRVQAVERELYPEVINWFADGRVRLDEGGRVHVSAREPPVTSDSGSGSL